MIKLIKLGEDRLKWKGRKFSRRVYQRSRPCRIFHDQVFTYAYEAGADPPPPPAPTEKPTEDRNFGQGMEKIRTAV